MQANISTAPMKTFKKRPILQHFQQKNTFASLSSTKNTKTR